LALIDAPGFEVEDRKMKKHNQDSLLLEAQLLIDLWDCSIIKWENIIYLEREDRCKSLRRQPNL